MFSFLSYVATTIVLVRPGNVFFWLVPSHLLTYFSGYRRVEKVPALFKSTRRT